MPLEIEKWLDAVDRGQKTKSHIKGVMRQVFEYAMADGQFPISRNPLELVKGAGKRTKQKRILTYEEWVRFISNVTAEPQHTAIITCLCLGVRREEVWALKWSDFNFVVGTVRIQRTIIGSKIYQRVKNDASEADLPLDESLIRLLLDWRSKSQFNTDADWVWASPFCAGEDAAVFQRDSARLHHPGFYQGRTWQDWLARFEAYLSGLVKRGRAPLGVQKDLMRRANIAATANVYGAGVLPAMREFNSQVVKRVIQ